MNTFGKEFDADEFAKLADEFLAQEPDKSEAEPEPGELDIYTVMIDGKPVGFVDNGISVVYGYGPDPGAPIGSLRDGRFVASQPWHRHEFDGKPVELVAVRQ